jgi:hypothetical protein
MYRTLSHIHSYTDTPNSPLTIQLLSLPGLLPSILFEFPLFWDLESSGFGHRGTNITGKLNFTSNVVVDSYLSKI